MEAPCFDCRKAHTQATSRITSERDICGVGNEEAWWLVVSLFILAVNGNLLLMWLQGELADTVAVKTGF